jgi:PadR family transcriptional regulator AphA
MKSSPVGSLSPEFVLLGLLDQSPAHGYELHQRLHRDLNQIWQLSQSQIYNILNRLEKQAYIRGTILEQDKLPAKRCFELTASGKTHFESWLFAPSPASVRAIRVEFTTRLFFAAAKNQDLATKIIEGQIVETKSSLTRLIDQESSIPEDQLFNKLGLDLRIRQLNSVLEWLESIIELLQSLPWEDSGYETAN